MRNLPKLLKLLFFVLLTMLVISNTQKIKQRPEIYINNTIIEKVNALDYKPTELINANVIVKTQQGSGSGSIIKVVKNGTYILTAAHVIYGEKIVRNYYNKLERKEKLSRNITVIFNKRKYKAMPIKVDKNLDLAIVKVYKKLNVAPVKIAKHEPKLGEIVWTISNPGGQSNVLNKGVFSSVNSQSSYIATAGYFGSSGGMALNTKGEQIGVISTVAIARIHGFFPSITVYNGITRTKDLNKFLKGIL